MTAPSVTFAAWMKAERERAGLSQDKLVAALHQRGLSIRQTQLSRMERGLHGVPLDWAVAIAGVFGATVDVALGLTSLDPDVQQLALSAARRAAFLYELKAAIAAELSVTV